MRSIFTKLLSEAVLFFKGKKCLAGFLGLLCCLVMKDESLYSQTVTVLSTPGASTFTIPAGVTSVKVEVWGAGGGGGGANSSASSSSGFGGGGGGGAYTVGTISVTPGQVISYTVGAGGAGGIGKDTANGGNFTGANGANTVFGTVTANGGNGGQIGFRNGNTSGNGYGGKGGVGGTGFYSGGNGGDGLAQGGGGGGGAGNNGNGGNGSAGGSGGTGSPNNTPYIGGNGGGAQPSNTDGNPGKTPGGGGGGGTATGGSTNRSTGGKGANGQVVLTYTPIAYLAQFVSMSTGSSNWCAGETRTVSVTVKNIGTATWKNSGPDVNIGVKWNADINYSVKTDANNLAYGNQQTYNLTITAPSTTGTNNLSFDVIKEGDCIFGNNNGSCGPGNTAYVSPDQTINAVPGAPTGLLSQSFCLINNPTVADLAATGTAIQWYTTASGGTALSSSSALVSGHYYASQTDAACESSSRLDVTVAINNPAAPTGNAAQSFCASANPTVASLAATGTNIKWYASAGGGSALSSSAALVNGTHYYASQTDVATGCESATRLDVMVSVNQAVVVTTQPADSQTECITHPVSFTVATTGDVFTYQWYKNGVALTDNSTISGSQSAVLSISQVALNDSGIYYVIINQSAACGPVQSNNAVLYVNQEIVIDQDPVPDTVCSGSTAVFTVNVTGTGISYQWQKGAASLSDGTQGSGSIVSGSGTATLTISNVSSADAGIYKVVLTSPTGSCGDATSKNARLVVNPIPTVNAVPDMILCNGTGSGVIAFSGTTPSSNTSYTWTNDNTFIGLGAGDTGNIASFTATNPGNSPLVAHITVTPSYTNGSVTCTGTPTSFTITVNPSATVTAVSDQTICNGSPTAAITFTSPTTGGSIVYKWTNDNTSIGLVGSGAGNIASFTATNPGTTPVTATIQVTPAYSNGKTCPGTPLSFAIKVNPQVKISPLTQEICNGGSITAIDITGSPSGTITSWTRTSPPGISSSIATSGSGPISGTFTNSNTGSVVVTFSINATAANGCTSVTTANVTVDAALSTPVLLSAQILCSSSSPSPLSVSVTGGNSSGYSYTWQKSANSTGPWTTVTGNPNTNSYLPPTPGGTTFYHVAVTNSCGSVTSNVIQLSIAANSGTSFSQSPDPAPLCSKDSFSYSIRSDITGSLDPTKKIRYTWQSLDPGYFTSSTTNPYGTTSFPSFLGKATFTVNNQTSVAVTKDLVITPVIYKGNGSVDCNLTPEVVTVTINPVPVIADTATSTCSGTAFTYTPVNGSPATNVVPSDTKYTWTVSAPAGITGASDQSIPQDSVSQTLVNATGIVQTVIYTVTPETTSGSCSGNTFKIMVTVNPLPLNPGAITGPTSTLCANTGGFVYSVSPVTGATYYVWTVPSGWTITSDSTQNSITVTTGSTGGTITVTAGNACGFSSVAGSLSVSVIASGTWLGYTMNWNDASNWCSGVPTATTDVTIAASGSGTYYLPQLTADAQAHNVTIASGAYIDLNGYTLTINGAFAGTGTLRGSATSGLTINGVAGTVYFKQGSPYNQLLTLNVNSGGSLSLGGSSAAGDTLNIVPGSLATGFGRVSVASGGTLNANSILTLKSSLLATARVALSQGVISGNVTIERYIPPRRAWRFLTVPFSSSKQSINQAWQEGKVNPDLNCSHNQYVAPGYGTAITYDGDNGYDPNITTNPSIKVWLNNNWAFLNSTVSVKILDYPAYCIFVRGDRTECLSEGTSASPNATVLRATGILNQFGGTNPFSRNYTGVPAGNFLLIGNPYASAINLQNVINGSRGHGFDNNKIWVWDPVIGAEGTYVSFTNGVWAPSTGSYPSGTNLPPIIRDGQAFMVQATGASVSVQFNENDKDTDETNVFGRQIPKSGHPAIFVNLLQQDGVTLLDGVAAGFEKQFSAAVDAKDAQKRLNDNENIMLLRNGKMLAIELRPLPTVTDTLFLSLYLKQQPYVLKVFSQYLPSTVPGHAWLVDKYLGTKTEMNLQDTALYSFTANKDTGSYKNRFMLVFTRGKDIKPAREENTITRAVVYPNPVPGNSFNLVLYNLKKDDYKVNIYNSKGSLIVTRSLDYKGAKNDYTIKLPAYITGGSYTVKVISKGGVVVSTIPVVVAK